jgi:hypothetical protein
VAPLAEQLLHVDADGLVGRRGPLVKAQESGFVLGGGEGDQSVVGGSSGDLPCSTVARRSW